MSKRFFLFSQDDEPLVEVEHGRFPCDIKAVGSFYLVVVHALGYDFNAAIYQKLEEAQAAVEELKDFVPTRRLNAFVFAEADEPVTALQVLDELTTEVDSKCRINFFKAY